MSYADCCEQGRGYIIRGVGEWYFDHDHLPRVKFCPFCGHNLNSPPTPKTLEEAYALLLTNPFPTTLVFDVDGVCADDRGMKPYTEREVYPWVPEFMRVLKKAGHTIIFQTARYMWRLDGDQRKAHEAGYEELKFWLTCKGIPFDKLYLGKASTDRYFDDKGCRVESNRGTTDWLTNLVPAVLEAQEARRAALKGS